MSNDEVTVPAHTVMDDSPKVEYRLSPVGTLDVYAVLVKGYGDVSRREAVEAAAICKAEEGCLPEQVRRAIEDETGCRILSIRPAGKLGD